MSQREKKKKESSDGGGYCRWESALHAAFSPGCLSVPSFFFAASGLRTVPHESGSGIATPCLETRWYGLEIMSVKERVKRCTHAQIFCALKRRLGLAERSCYSIRTWTAANGRQRELEIMRVRYTAQCLRSNSLSLITPDVMSESGRWHLTASVSEGTGAVFCRIS